MLELARERGLVEKLLAVDRPELWIAEHLGLDGLERDLPAGERVLGEVDRPGRALPKQFLNLVFADLEAQVDFKIVSHGAILYQPPKPHREGREGHKGELIKQLSCIHLALSNHRGRERAPEKYPSRPLRP